MFTKEQTDNLYELSKEEPRKNYVKIEMEEYIESLRGKHGIAKSIPNPVQPSNFSAFIDPQVTGNLMHDMVKYTDMIKNVSNNVINNTPTVNVHYDSMYRFEGDVNDIKHLTEQLTKIADKSSMKAADNAIRKLAGGIRH